ncbi:MAG: peroxiredoxin [Minisyncoccales bacterium]
MIKVGEKIPDFTLEAYHEKQIKKIRLSDYAGQWLILFFYPADFTFVCPTELEEMAQFYEEFKKLGAEVLSVSTDTVFVHKAWHDSSPAVKKVKFPMVADPTAILSRTFGTYIENEGVSLRASFIIDPEQKVVAFEMNDNSIGRSAQELLRRLQAAQYTREHKGEVCPASWKPGDKTLKPNLDIVGKI